MLQQQQSQSQPSMLATTAPLPMQSMHATMTVQPLQSSPLAHATSNDLNLQELSLQKHMDHVNLDSPSSVRNLLPATSNLALTPVLDSMQQLQLFST
jgi:hypothetical protein